MKADTGLLLARPLRSGRQDGMDCRRVLVIEDEEPIRVGLCDVLVFHGLLPSSASDGAEGLQKALEGSFDLLMVDVMLPSLDGFSIVREVRAKKPSQAMLVLTAKGAEADVLQGFAAGADDYVAKPFSVAQLMARVHALLRRSGSSGRRRFPVGGSTVDVDALQLEGERGAVPLSPRDIEILAYLSERAGRVISRDELLRSIWGFQRLDHVETRCVDMHLSKLRRKIGQATETELIETVRGAGYRVSAS
jgi:two-component system response regulator RegX3